MRGPIACLNCDKPIDEARLFCSDLCKDEAGLVRYWRACHRDGRVKRPDVREAIQIKLGMVLGGGYPARERRVSKSLRAAVIERDGGKCRKCGAPANQVDHIADSSNELDNLQLLCVTCHNEKTAANFVTITPESHPEKWEKYMALLARVQASSPRRMCDRDDWSKLWQAELKRRRDELRGAP